jgi:hypothetical protein
VNELIFEVDLTPPNTIAISVLEIVLQPLHLGVAVIASVLIHLVHDDLPPPIIEYPLHSSADDYVNHVHASEMCKLVFVVTGIQHAAAHALVPPIQLVHH